jgi:hypothetical protein
VHTQMALRCREASCKRHGMGDRAGTAGSCIRPVVVNSEPLRAL